MLSNLTSQAYFRNENTSLVCVDSDTLLIYIWKFKLCLIRQRKLLVVLFMSRVLLAC